MKRPLILISYLLVFSQPSWANAKDAPIAVRDTTCTDLQQEITRLKNTNLILDTVIKNLINRIEVLEQTALGNQEKDTQHLVGSDENLLQQSINQTTQAQLQRDAEENYQLIQSTFEQRLGKEEGMLLGPYKFVYEPSLSYAHSSYDKIVVDGFSIFPVLVVGDIVSELVKRDIVTNNHSFRVGLPLDTQFDIVVPIGYEKERTYRGDGTYEAQETTGLGDISLALSHQLVKSNTFWPDTIIGLSWKSTTGDDPYALMTTNEPALGSGFETWGTTLTMMTTLDPIVLFGGLSGTYTSGEEKEIGYVKPGQSYGINLGMALALNLDTSLSFNYQYNYTMETEIEGQQINGSYLTTSIFSIGLSNARSDHSAIDVDLGIGLTRDSPDFQLTVSYPFTFSLTEKK